MNNPGLDPRDMGDSLPHYLRDTLRDAETAHEAAERIQARFAHASFVVKGKDKGFLVTIDVGGEEIEVSCYRS